MCLPGTFHNDNLSSVSNLYNLWGRIVPGENCPGENCPGEKCPGGELSAGENCPRTEAVIVRETEVEWEMMVMREHG